MNAIYLAQKTASIFDPIANLLGLLMNGIYVVLSSVGIHNIGLSIIFFTLVVNILMIPLTVKQQRFSKLQSKMSPELNAIRKKYAGRRDNDAMLAQNEETKAVYAKYGVSQMGSCLPLLFSFIIIIPLYSVVQNIPMYVDSVRTIFEGLATSLLNTDGSPAIMQALSGAARYTNQFTETMSAANPANVNTYITVLNHASTADWNSLVTSFPTLSDTITSVQSQLEHINNFLGLNIANSPSFMFGSAWEVKNILLMAAALIIPFLSAATQWVNAKLMPQQATSNDPNDPGAQMAKQMKTMNVIMPLFSAYICFTLPIGVGLYWIAQAVIRGVLQVIVNKRIDRMDIDAMIEKNKEKYQEKLEKKGERTANMSRYANMNTRNMTVGKPGVGTSLTQEEKDARLNKARQYYESGKARPDSLLRAANSVRAFDEKNNN